MKHILIKKTATYAKYVFKNNADSKQFYYKVRYQCHYKGKYVRCFTWLMQFII